MMMCTEHLGATRSRAGAGSAADGRGGTPTMDSSVLEGTRTAAVSRRALIRGATGAPLAGKGVAGTACATGSPSSAPAAPAKLKEPASLVFWSILGGADGTRMHDMTGQYVNETPLVKIEDI